MKEYIKSTLIGACLMMVFFGIGLIAFGDIDLTLRIIIGIAVSLIGLFGIYLFAGKLRLSSGNEQSFGFSLLARSAAITILSIAAFFFMKSQTDISRGVLIICGSLALSQVMILPYQIWLYIKRR